jgi:2-phosphoglycerate kinase
VGFVLAGQPLDGVKMAYPWDVRKNAIFQGVEASKAVMRDVAANRRSLALIGGGSGIGKTYHLRQIAKRHLIHHVPEDNKRRKSG